MGEGSREAEERLQDPGTLLSDAVTSGCWLGYWARVSQAVPMKGIEEGDVRSFCMLSLLCMHELTYLMDTESQVAQAGLKFFPVAEDDF